MSNYKRNAATTCGWFMALLLSALLAGCGGGGIGSGIGDSGPAVLPGAAGSPGASATDPTVGSASPGSGATNVPTSTNSWNGVANVVTSTLLRATFTQPMNPATINSSPAGTLLTFTLKETTSGTNVPGTVAMNAANTVATFAPTAAALAANRSYTATVTTAAKNAGGTAMANPVSWSFTTNATALTGQAPVNLGTASNYVVFAGTGIDQALSRTPAAITGDIGVGPAVTSTAITGFGLILPAGSAFSTSAEITGRAFARDYAVPSPADVTTARDDMIAAYSDAAGRTAAVGAPFLNLQGGNLTTQTLAPGVYTWGGGVSLLPAQILTLSGGPNDVWIFQIAGTLTTAATSSVSLIGGALPKNVFWQVAGASVNVGAAPAHFEGVVLAQVAINFGNQASANSRLLAQAAVNLNQNALTPPAP